MACRECVKGFHQKQSTPDQRADSDSLKSQQPEMLSGSEGIYQQMWSSSSGQFHVVPEKHTTPQRFFFFFIHLYSQRNVTS